MKENWKLIQEKIKEKCSWEFIDGVELAYMIGCDNKCIEKLENYIREYSADGINTFGLFIKECIDFLETSNNCSISEFFEKDLEECMNKFIEKYFEKE